MALFGLVKEKASEEQPGTAQSGPALIEPEGFPRPYLPSLSLVPESRLSLLRRRRATRKAVVIALVCFAAIAAILVVLAATLIASKAAEKAAIAEEQTAQDEVTALAPVADLYDGFEKRQSAVANALSSDVDYYTLITEVQDAIQAEIPREALTQDATGQWYVKDDYANIGLVQYDITANPCPSDQVFQPEPSLGCIQGTAVSSSYTKAGEVIKALNESGHGLFGGYILSAADGKPNGSVGTTTWTFSINFGAGALSNKYADESTAILGGNSVPSPGPSAGASAQPSTSPTTEGGNY